MTSVASPRGWEAQYEDDFAAQKSSGPIVFTEEQRRKNKEVLSRVTDLLPFADAYKVNDCDLIYRFLIGKHWNVNLTEKGLREYIEVRKEKHLDGLIGEQLHPTIGAVLCPCYSNGVPCPIYGLDKDGLPILWLSPDAAKVIAAMKQFTGEQLLQGQMRAIELGRFVCRARGVDRCTYVIDLGGITMSSVNKATLGFLKGVMNMLQVAYPEIMRRLLIFNTGWAVSAAWKVLRPFVDVRVQDKIKFESGAPTLTALQPYMAADQVHPAFGGTGRENVLDAIIEPEIRRVRGLAEGSGGGAPSESASFSRERSVTNALDNGSLFDVDPQALHSFCSPALNENRDNMQPDAASTAPDRMVIGVPGAVSAYMANMGEEGDGKDALDISLSVASSSGDYAVGRSVAEADGSHTLPLKEGCSDSSTNTAVPPSQRSPTTSAAAGASPPSSSANGESCKDSEATNRGGGAYLTAAGKDEDATQQQQPLPIISVSLTYGADGSITGYCGQRCVGQFRNGRLYARPRELDGDSTSSHATSCVTSPALASPGSLPGNGSGGNGAHSGRQSGQQQQQQQLLLPSLTSRTNPPAGELLYESGHPIHNFYIVCDGQRNARYLLRRSRLRTRLAVYNVVGGAPVRTEKGTRHYVEGERAKLGVVVPSTNPTSDSKGDWMLYGEDVTQRSPGEQIKHFFSKTKRSSAPPPSTMTTSERSGGTNTEEKEGSGWAATILTALRNKAMSATTSPLRRKAKSATQRGVEDTAATTTSSADAGNSGSGSQLLAENKGQTVYFYNLLTKNTLSDLFALAVAITLSWSGELEDLKENSSPSAKNKRYVPDDEDFLT